MTPSTPPDSTAGAADSIGDDHPRQIGPYRILRVLGEGGIGLVYLAEQSVPVRRRVALKVIKVGMDTHQVVARFESERQALAVMDHPNIAHVLDAGAADNGRPYFVMECVHGVPITDYCDTERLSIDERISLFIDVCAAIQHAHQKGVVHRDLKPSNILVGAQEGKPLVKVIDFGIAKAMGQGLTDRTLVTNVGQLLGTPAYMSPEQAAMSGVDVDTRTDIYSLGVVLYELLAGALPMDLGAVPDYALPHALRDTDVPTPSARLTTLGDAGDAIARHRRTDVKRLRRDLRGDLDWIAAKAMEKDRTRRYETVESFATDLRRHLEHLPVLARPRSAGYVFARFLKRNKAAVAAGAIALLALTMGAVLATAGFVRATRAEQEARQQAQTAQRTAEFLVDLFEVSDPSEARGNTVTAREILDRGAERIRRELADERATQAALMNTIGTVYRQLGLFADSRVLLEESLATRRAIFGERSPEALAGMISLGELLYQTPDLEAAEPMLRQALALSEELKLPGDIAIAEAMADLGVVLASPGRRELTESVELQRKALAIYLRELGTDHPDVATVKSNLASALSRVEMFEEAETLKREAIAITERHLGPRHASTANQVLGLAQILSVGSRRAEAEALFRSALATLRDALGDGHPRVANAERQLALLLLADGRYAEAESALRSALAAYIAASAGGEVRVARTWSDLGLVHMLVGRDAEAEEELRRAVAIFAEGVEPVPTDGSLAQLRLADLLVSSARYEEGRAVAQSTPTSVVEDQGVRRAYAASITAAALAGLGQRSEAEGLRINFLPDRQRPYPIERLAAARIVALYALWATPDAVEALRAELAARGFDASADAADEAGVRTGS